MVDTLLSLFLSFLLTNIFLKHIFPSLTIKIVRYFLIIDDLWAISVWDVISHAFPEGNHSSRIITTTEIGDVAVACCTYQPKYIFKMEPLNFSHSKELFTSGVFGYGEEDYHQLDEASDEIVRRCAGLPLAIISIASVASQEEADAVQNRDETRERWLWKWVHKFVYSIMAAFSQTYHRINLIQPHKNSTTGGGVHNFILKSLPTNTTYGEKMKQVLNLCYNSLPICVQTCLLYLSLYPENYIILKEDIVKQWIAEGFILAPTEKDIMKVAGSYFDMLVNMGLIQHIDVDSSDEVLYYVVHHMVHGYITSKSIEANFITVLDYSQRTMRFSNKVSRLSLQFGSTRHATSPASTTTGLSQVWSLSFFGLMSCQPSIFGFKLLRSVILHIWADQPSTGVDLRRISELLLLRSLQVTCNDNVLLPDLMQGPKHLETLEINARVAYIPSNIIHLRSWLHLRLGVGTELPDVTGILPNVTQNPPISLDELSSPPNSVMTIELLPPICSIPKWIGHLTKLCSLKIVLRELDDISNLQGLPALTVLSLYVLRRTNIKPISFTTEGFAALEYFEFRCGVLCLTFEEGAMPSLQRIKLAFNAHGGEQNGCSFVGIEDMLSLQKISVLIGSAVGAEEPDLKFAESAVKKALGKHHSNVSIKRADRVEEEFDPPEKHHSIRGNHLSTSVEQPGSGKQEADTNSQLINRTSDKKEHAIVESRTDPLSSKEKFQENCSDIIRMTIHMGLFAHAKVVRLKSRHDKYLYADEDQLHVTQDRNGSSPNARWTVETVPHAPWAVRLRSCYGRYLAASSELFLLGMTGRKVLQVAPPPARRPDSSVEWEPVWDGFQERLRSRVGAGRGREGSSKYLRANAGIPPWRNSVTHDVPHRSSTHDWVLWDVEIVQVLTPGPATPAGPRPRRVDARPGLAARNQALQA